jgi:GDP-4-dehydro-6-deoxy-D-mannose reductase
VATPLPFARILLTGAHGFVGRRLAPELASRLHPGARLVLATRSPDDAGCDPGGSERIAFDLNDPAGVHQAIGSLRPDLVVHLAAQSSVGHSARAAADTWSSNLCGSLALARALAETAPDCTLLFVSSVEVYGLTFNEGPVTERSPLRPYSVYARSKAAAEAMFADVLPAEARLIVARPSNHSGLDQGEAFVIPAFAAQIARIEQGASPVIRVGNLDAERDFLDVRDVVCAYLALLERAETLPMRSTFNIASGHTVQIGSILDRLRGLCTVGTSVEQDPQRMRASEVERTAIDATALARAVGWAPRHSLDDMLPLILDKHRSRSV